MLGHGILIILHKISGDYSLESSKQFLGDGE